MITRIIRNSLAHAEGQALVLTCVVMLVLTLGVLTTIHLGRGVHERIRIQNTADSAAYSTAALEARLFNFYAFSNRTQVSHYVSAMIWQSSLSFIYWGEAFLTDVYGMLKTLNPCAHPSEPMRGPCQAVRALPYIGPVIAVISTIIGIYRDIVRMYQTALRNSHADEVVGKVAIPAHLFLNKGMSALAGALAAGTLPAVANASERIARQNDPEVRPGSLSSAFGPLNACLFKRAHYHESSNPLPRFFSSTSPLEPTAVDRIDRVARAKRVMAQAANATRYSCDTAGTANCQENFVTSRKLSDVLPSIPWLAPIRFLSSAINKYGQTRLMSFDPSGHLGRSKNRIRIYQDTPRAPSGKLAQGDVLASDDLYKFTFLGTWGDPNLGRGRREQDFENSFTTSIWAMSDAQVPGGIHWRVSFRGYPRGHGQVDPTGDEAELGLNSSGALLGGLLGVYKANVRAIQDGNHPWDGIAPFPHFEAGKYFASCVNPTARADDLHEAGRGDDFNQPSVWVSFYKSLTGSEANNPAPLSAGGTVRSIIGREELVMADSRISFPGMQPGLNAVSRAQVYYHRPGNWHEQPNFFNPYWRPRLAAVYQARDSATAGALFRVIPSSLTELLPRTLTH